MVNKNLSQDISRSKGTYKLGEMAKKNFEALKHLLYYLSGFFLFFFYIHMKNSLKKTYDRCIRQCRVT